MELKSTLMDGGYCWHPERMVCEGRSWTNSQFPSLFALIEHPQRGLILFDTGYSSRFSEVTARFPYKLYAIATPVQARAEDVAVSKLKRLGISPSDISTVVISHFHADHMGAIADFPNAEYVFAQRGWDAIKQKRGLSAVLQGVLPPLIPADFEKRARGIEFKDRVTASVGSSPARQQIEKHFLTFDLFGDGTVQLVDLPGHMAGHMGISYLDHTGKQIFLVSDACWQSRSYRELLYPHQIAYFIMENKKRYKKTIQDLHEIYQACGDLAILPTHCGEVYRDYVLERSWAPEALNGIRCCE